MENSSAALYRLILKRRSIRRFKEKKIPMNLLKKIVNAGRLAPSASNLQPLEFIVVNKKSLNEKIFENLRWAAYLKDGTPKENERPTAYIILLVNLNIKKEGFEFDCGAAAENICLAALSFGIGSCIIGSVKREEVMKILNIPSSRAVAYVIALGYPKEKAIAEDMKNNDIKYYRDVKNIHHVPKRKFLEIIHFNFFRS